MQFSFSIEKAEGGKAIMFKTVNFNIYEENLEEIVYGESVEKEKTEQKKDSTEQPIPKPPPQYWTYPLSYRRSSRESEKTGGIL